MRIVRKHRNLFVGLLLALFAISLNQACYVGLGKQTESTAQVLIKISPYLAGGTSFSNLDKAHQRILFFPAKIFIHFASGITWQHVTVRQLFGLSGHTVIATSGTSILGLSCKLQI